jgi:hypothetical protein
MARRGESRSAASRRDGVAERAAERARRWGTRRRLNRPNASFFPPGSHLHVQISAKSAIRAYGAGGDGEAGEETVRRCPLPRPTAVPGPTAATGPGAGSNRRWSGRTVPPRGRADHEASRRRCLRLVALSAMAGREGSSPTRGSGSGGLAVDGGFGLLTTDADTTTGRVKRPYDPSLNLPAMSRLGERSEEGARDASSAKPPPRSAAAQ